MAQPGALRRPSRAGGGRRSSARTTGSCAPSPWRRRTCARSCSSPSSGSRRCSCSSAWSGCASWRRRTRACEGLGTLQARSSTYDEIADAGEHAAPAPRVPQRRRSRRRDRDRCEELVRRAALGARRRGDPVRPVGARAVDERGDLRVRAAAGRRADAQADQARLSPVRQRDDHGPGARQRRCHEPKVEAVRLPTR